MKLCLVQKNINTTDIEPFIYKAIEKGCDLVALPELSNTGCVYKPAKLPPLEDVITGLKQINFPIIAGVGYSKDDLLYNACLYVHGEEYYIYHKINLFPPFNEPDIFQPGRDVKVWETEFGKIGAAICYDIRFGDIFSDLAERGAEMVFIPAAFPRVRIGQWRELLISRAKKNKLKVIGINAVGSDGQNEFGGTSMVVDERGSVLAGADETTETIVEVVVA
jgi:predicted amidohydrolase